MATPERRHHLRALDARRRQGLLYFRDPAGNLFEMYCRKTTDAATFARGAKQGGSYTLDFAALNYEWRG